MQKIVLGLALIGLAAGLPAAAGSTWVQTPGITQPTGTIITDINGNIFAGTTAGLLKSSDGGASWTTLKTDLLPNVGELHIDRKGNIYIGSGSRLYKSSDGGSTFSVVYSLRDASSQIAGLTIDGNDNVYVGAPSLFQSEVAKSSDGGASWTGVAIAKVDNGLTVEDAPIKALAVDANGKLIAATLRGLFVEKEGALLSRVLLTDQGSNLFMTSLGFDQQGAIYAAGTSSSLSGNPAAQNTSTRIFKRSKDGQTWSDVAGGLPVSSILALTIGADGTIYIGTTEGVYSSSNNGSSWVLLNDGLKQDGRIVWAMTTDAKGTVFAATQKGIFRLVAGANTWTATLAFSGASPSPTLTASLAPNASDSGQNGCSFFAAMRSDSSWLLYGAQGWTPFNPAKPEAFTVAPLASTQATLLSNTALAGLSGTQVYAGYGRGNTAQACLADMVQNQMFKQMYVIQ
ncbi:hypothetical protein [Chitinimonas sp.]|uniref:hypothetical protein n=1 Tax=Chitinimonas sp. TaxID=1934313 RepID=UPI0035B4E0EE